MSERRNFDIVIIGGGMVGASLAYFLTERGVGDVLLVEREAQPGYHASGRSAASLVEFDLNPTVLNLKADGGRFLREPPAGFSANPLLKQSQILFMFRKAVAADLDGALTYLERARVKFQILNAAQSCARVPVLKLDSEDRGLLLTEDGRIDIHELLSSYLRHARHRGAAVEFGKEVRGVIVERGRCAGVVTDRGEYRARWVVNAAGAWAGKISRLAGAAPIALEPRRRSIVTFAAPDGLAFEHWPFVISDADQLYFAPEAGDLMLSPMDQVPMEPCDARPDDYVFAEAFERLKALAPAIVPRALKHRWAGLRTFSADGVPVVGEDPIVKGFFWLAGQAGYGIESSPAVAPIAADLLLTGKTDRFDASMLAPARFA